MNCYNGETFLIEALNSVFNQDYENWEIIFWDNCSNDKSYEIVKSYNDKRIRYYRGNKTVSLGEARNFALKEACGIYLAFLDVDDLWEQTKLSKEIDIFDKYHNVGLIYSRFTIFSKGEYTALRLSNNAKKNKFINIKNLLNYYDIGLSGTTIKKEIIDANNIQFNAKYSLIEDYDFFMKIACFSKVYYISDVLMKYRIHENNYSKNYEKWLHEYKNFIYDIELNKKKFPLLYENHKAITWYVVMCNVRYLIHINKKLEAMKQIFLNFHLYPKLIAFMVSIIFGEELYARMKEIIYNIIRKI
jgi:glycosyltransferase involved in cell wall biosynthesis